MAFWCLLLLMSTGGTAHYAAKFQESIDVIDTHSKSKYQPIDISLPWLSLLASNSSNSSGLFPSHSRNISKQCNTDLFRFITADLKEPWKSTMLDATGRPQAGLYKGNLFALGAYDQCMAVRAPQFQAKYCAAMLPLQANNPQVVLKWGMCVPETCSQADVALILNSMENVVAEKAGVVLPVKTVMCQEHKNPLDAKAVCAIVTLSILLAAVVLGTGYDAVLRLLVSWRMRNQRHIGAAVNADTEQSGSHIPADQRLSDESTPLLGDSKEPPPVERPLLARLLLAFSVLQNGERLLDTRVPPGSLHALHGVRFLSMTWVILGHSYAFALTYYDNPVKLGPVMQRWSMQAVLSGTFSVDSFFLLSGLLVTYLFLREREKSGRVNWFLFYFHRFWRLTPVYMLMLMTSATLTRYFGSGPLFPQSTGFEVDQCRNSWFYNLFYINNLSNKATCFGWAWYLANDMQFYIISPIILIPLVYSKIAGAVIIMVLLAVHITCVAVLTHKYKFGMGLILGMAGRDPHHTFMNTIYNKPYCRVGVYVIGMMAGAALHRCRGSLRLKLPIVLLGWIVAVVIALADVYGLVNVYRGESHPSTSVAALYNSVSRPVWALALSWLVLMCCTGNGGPIATFLSWRGFVPLSRLTYCAYLVHPMIMFVYNGSMRKPYHFDDFTQISLFLSFLAASYGVALVVSLCFEAPFMQLEKLFIRRK